MRDVDYAILEKRIRRLERLIANERLNQKNEFLGLGKKKPTEDSGQSILDTLNEDDTYEHWKKRGLSNGWQDYSVTGKIVLELRVSNQKIPRAKTKVEYKVLIRSTNLKKARLEITQISEKGNENVILDKFVPLDKPAQVKKASDLIINSINPSYFS